MTEPTDTATTPVKEILVTKHAIGTAIEVPGGGWTLVSSQVLAVERKSGDEPAPQAFNQGIHKRRLRSWLLEDDSRLMVDYVDPDTGAETNAQGRGTVPVPAPGNGHGRMIDENYVDETVYLTWSKT